MGLRGSALLAATALLAGAACTTDDPSPATAPSTTTAEPTTDDGTGIGGSRYLALVRRAGAGYQVVVEDLVEGDEEVVRATADHFDGVAVNADGLVAWAQPVGPDRYGVSLAADMGEDPVEVETTGDVGCPQWRDSGSLLVTVDILEPRLALVDPTTGVPEMLPVDFDSVGCAAPAGPDHVVFARPLGDETFGPRGAVVVRAAIDGRGEEIVGHIPPGCWANDVSASPDGTRLAAQVLCNLDVGGRQALYAGSMDDDLEPLVAENPPDADGTTAYQYWSPSWSADGTVIAYHRYDPADGPEGSSDVWTVSARGGEPEAHGSTSQSSPSFSPPTGDGRD